MPQASMQRPSQTTVVRLNANIPTTVMGQQTPMQRPPQTTIQVPMTMPLTQQAPMQRPPQTTVVRLSQSLIRKPPGH